MFLIPLARRVACAFVALCLGYATHASAQQITLKLHHFVPPSATAHARFLLPWVERIEKESNGRIKIQIYPASNRWVTKLLAILGATPMGMPVGQVPDALLKHVTDGAAMPREIIPSLKVHELVKFHSELPVLALPKVHTNHEPCSRCICATLDPPYRLVLVHGKTDPKSRALYTTGFVVAMNPAKYASLPDDLKRVIAANSGADFSAMAGKMWDDAAAPHRKLAEARGNQISVISQQELQHWAKVSQPVFNAWFKEVGTKGWYGSALLKSAKQSVERFDPNLREVLFTY